MNIRIDVRLIDQKVYGFMQARANGDEVHLVVCDLPDELDCSLATLYRAIKRLQNAGKIARLDGSNKTGYTYRICA